MPRCVLETLAVGRPVVAMHLPQLESVIRPGVSGYLVARDGSRDDMVEALVQRFVDVRDAIEMGAINPVHVADAIKAFTPSTQLARVYRYHQEIQDARGLAAAAPTY
jgi:glycosyltransferase involved in cell wall biosynthesis